MELIEKVIMTPDKPTEHRRMFLSNIDLSLVVDQESVSFFDQPRNNMSLSEAYNRLCSALGSILVAYDFMAGRLVPSLEASHRFEIDCNGAGVVVAAARTTKKLSEFGDLLMPKKEFSQLVAFLHEEGEKEMDLKDKPLLSMQLTQLGCGSLAMASRYNHCTLDGVAVRDFEANLASLTRGDNLVISPDSNRSIFKARNPPKIAHPHFEYSNAIITNNVFTARGTSHGTNTNQFTIQNNTHMIYLSQQHIADMKKAALEDGKLKKCTTFQVVAARIWKARSIAMKMVEETTSTMLFPVDARKRVVPEAPRGFSGNALVPGHARASVRELIEEDESYHVRKVQEGMERLNDDYIRSGIDWLEVHRGVPSHVNSFSLVAWWRLGLEEDVFEWGRVKCTTSVLLKPGLVLLLPGLNGGLNICLELPDDQAEEFSRLITKV